MTGLEVLCAGLSELGVRHVFGLPGTQNAELFTTLPDYDIRPVLATHEASASFMGNGYARASGRPGVIATIPGPGFAFALPGLAEARLDSVPLLHLVGTPPEGTKRFLHQAIDQAGIAGSLVKEVVEVRTAGEVATRLRQAHQLTLEGEPGPVVLHLDRQALRAPVPTVAGPGALSAEQEPVGAGPAWAEELRTLVTASERPALFVGGGALDCAKAVRELAEHLSAPTFTTLTARGVLSEDHRCSIAFDADRGGLEALNDLLDDADLVLALGCKFSHNGTAGFGLRLGRDRLIHVNTDSEALGSSYPARLQIHTSVEEVLEALSPVSGRPRRARWTDEALARAKADIGTPHPPRGPEPRFADMPEGTAASFFKLLRQILPRDAIVVTDSGLHQVMTRRYYEVLEPRGLITPADFQSMGFGLPAALGAALAVPGRPVVAIVGDGGFLMSAMDLVCAAREKVPVTAIVFNDGHLNLIRLQQIQDEGVGSAVRLATPDLEALATAMGIGYGRLDGAMDVTLRDAVSAPGPTLLEVRLGDSVGIRALRGAGLARRALRRTLGRKVVDRLKDWRRAIRGR